ncbi:DUF5691 domain-containing protein [Sinomonas mesophila]|uniref:DUF5691 domain-containing protein n=1 Tax=Sinomonas mesophila TaxID=1531955 RepID=UPI0009853019|nr:DUF5691 domain-containing protein [Sinomonas mesophila]
MTWFEDLRTTALVGTARSAPPAVPAELGVRPPEGPAPEELLLGEAALADAASRASRRPGSPASAAPDPAPDDDGPQAAGEAARLLDLLLSQPPVSQGLQVRLVADWLRLAGQAGQRVPHRLLPALLDLASASEDVAGQLAPALGTRGRWLRAALGLGDGGMATPAEPPSEDWAELSPAAATAELERLRATDPAASRELLRAHWDGLGARERAAHLAAFTVNLGPEDEPLLEAALDDGAKGVRTTAAGLLDRLPGSARAARMAQRLEPLLSVKGVLRRRLEIALPPAPDAAALRDGIAPDPRTGEPDRLARLDAIIRGAPLGVWTGAAGGGPPAALALLKGEDRAIAAILATALARRDAEWAPALLAVRPDARLLGVLPAREREAHVLEALRPEARLFDLVTLLRALPVPWGQPVADAVLGLIATEKGAPLAAMLADVLPAALPPDAVDRCRHLLEKSDGDAARRRVLRDVVQYHSFRLSLQQSFRQSLTEAFR